MLLKNLPYTLLSSFAKWLPAEEKLWADAMMGELASISGYWKRLLWALSGSWGLSRICMRFLLKTPRAEGDRPPAITLIALYHAGFSCVLLGVLVWQAPGITEPWKEAWLPVVFALLIVLLPGVIALGLWVLDDAARYMAVLFSLLHAIANYALLSTRHMGWKPLPTGRILLDLMIVVVLMLPAMKRAFRPSPVELRLGS